MINWIRNLLLGRWVGSVIRHAMTAIGAWLVLPHLGLEPEVVAKFVESGTAVAIGVATWLVGQLASLAEKKLRED